MNKEFWKGLWKENPTFVMMVGMCPTLAVTTAVINGVAMGLATTAVLVFSNLIISLLRKVIPNAVRIPAFIVVIASLVTITDMVMAAYTPDIHKVLGLFIPLIIVNCIIMGRAEAFASKKPLGAAFWDGLGMGVGFTWALTLIGAVREILGAGTFFGFSILGSGYQPVILALLPPGAFITMGLIVAIFKAVEISMKKKHPVQGGIADGPKPAAHHCQLSVSE